MLPDSSGVSANSGFILQDIDSSATQIFQKNEIASDKFGLELELRAPGRAPGAASMYYSPPRRRVETFRRDLSYLPGATAYLDHLN